jgi:pilus assembly protein CpaB
MSNRLLGVLLFAFVVSATASFFVYKLLEGKLGRQPEAPGTKLIVAARPLPIGTLLKPEDLKVADWRGAVPARALNVQEEMVGRGVTANIFEGEPILEDRLALKGAGAGMAATIPIGMRAVAVRVNEVVGVSGFATPGMRVDILLMGVAPNMPQQLGTVSRTLLQNIEILSAGQVIQKDNEGKPMPVPVVNLLVTPEQAEILSLASNNARIQLVLRNPLDTKETQTNGAAMAQLFGGAVPGLAKGTAPPGPAPKPRMTAPPNYALPAPKKKETPPPLIVEVLHGSKRATAKFEDDSKK